MSNINTANNQFLRPFLLIFSFAIIEAIGGWYTGSLALLGDAGHMASDVAALGLAWFAASHAQKAGISKHASGLSYAEIAVSIINVLLMLAVVAWIMVEAWQRFNQPAPVAGAEVMLIALLGLIVNIIVAKMLHADAHGEDNLNQRAAFLHVLGDLLGSIAALLAGAVIYFTGYLPIDPILSILISLLILAGTLNLAKDIWCTLHGYQAHQHGHHDHDEHHGHKH